MEKKSIVTIGIDYTPTAVRAARTTCKKSGGSTVFLLEKLEELKGDFTKETNLIGALKDMKQQMNKGGEARFVTCVSGKQVFAAELPFRRVPLEEMKNALKFEIRKNIPFEVRTSTIDYQIKEPVDKNSSELQVIVTAVANSLLTKHLKNLEKAGIKPDIVDVLPFTVANALFTGKKDIEPDVAGIIMYLGPEVCTFVVDGEECTFFHRNIYFPANMLFGSGNEKTVTESEKARRLEVFIGELVRSISFYKQSYHVSAFSGVFLMGEYAGFPELNNIISQKTGIATKPVGLSQHYSQDTNDEAWRFDLAVSLAMRSDTV